MEDFNYMDINKNKIKSNKKFLKEKKLKKNVNGEKKTNYKGIISAILILSMAKISIDSYIYNLNQKSNEISGLIEAEEAEKENLMLQISKSGNLPNLIEIAKNELKMKFATDEDYIKVDVSTKYFDDIPEQWKGGDLGGQE